MRNVLLVLLYFLGTTLSGFSQDNQGEKEALQHAEDCSVEHHDINLPPYNPGKVAVHHISDQNILTLSFFLKEFRIPLPCILYVSGQGLSVFSSGKFHPNEHGDGDYAYRGFVLREGVVKRVKEIGFPTGLVEIDGFREDEEERPGFVVFQGKCYEMEGKTTWDAGIVGGAITSFYDLSITKDVLTLLIVALLFGWVFFRVARAYKKQDKQAPKGLQNFIEPFFIFIRDEVARPVIGPRYETFMPFIMSLFFFVLGLNLIGQIPFLGNPNLTGNIAVTGVLAIFTFLVTNLVGNRNYWQHIFWMPGIPLPIKLILTPIEFLGLFIKPFTLMIRLFANISAGHVAMMSFVGLIFILGQSGQNIGGGIGGVVISTLLTLFMSCIELLVAFIQAFIFAILSASYIGAAIEEHH